MLFLRAMTPLIPRISDWFLLLIFLVSPEASAERGFSLAHGKEIWAPVDELVNQQKFQAALDKTEKILAEARKTNDTAQWTRALIRKALLEQGLHATETAVENFRKAPWPEQIVARSLLELFYAESVRKYVDTYAYEIGRREKIVSTRELDLKKWDQESLFHEINQSYARVWEHREALSAYDVADFPEFIVGQGYPKGIRSNFRDFLTYRWAALFADSSTWPTKDHQDLYKLKLEKLLVAGAAPKLDLLSSAPHPLEKLATLLDDLFLWHRARKAAEPELETQLERARTLHKIFSDEANRERIRNKLEQELKSYTKVAWWSAGQYWLASFYRDSGQLERAHELAAQGENAFPGSLGSQQCATLAKAIEAPDFQLQGMGVDRAGARSVLINHKNLPKLYFRAFRLDFVSSFRDRGWELLDGSSRFNRDVIHKSRPLKTWSVDLAKTPDFKLHKTFVTPPLSEEGFYIIAASPREDFSVEKNRLVSLPFLISPLALVRQQTPDGGQEFFLRRGADGSAVSHATLAFYEIGQSGRAEPLKTLKTDEQGHASLSPAGLSQRNLFCVATHEGHLTFDREGLWLYPQHDAPARSGALIYTDRSIYRPQQKIFFKVVTYNGDFKTGVYRVAPKFAVRVVFRDGNHQEIGFQDLVTNAYGSAAGEFTIPGGRLLGRYTLEAMKNSVAVRVEEYKRPTFEVELLKPKAALRLNTPATISGQAKYYFGMPLSNGKVTYRVTRQTQYPYWYFWRCFWMPRDNQQRQIAAGEATLRENGEFQIAFKPEADPDLPEKNGVYYIYGVSVDITDDGGETQSAQKNYPIGYVAVQAGINMERDLVLAGEAPEVKILRSDLSAVPQPGKARYRLVRLVAPEKTRWPSEKILEPAPKDFHLPDDRLQPRWASYEGRSAEFFGLSDGVEIAKGDLEHDQEGLAVARFPATLSPGLYRLRYETRDEYGEKYETQKEFIVADGKFRLNIPIYLVPKTTTARVGEKLELFFGGGDAGQMLLLEFSKNGEVFRRELLESGKGGGILSLPITESLRGGFTVHVFAVHDYQMFQEQAGIYVPWDNKELQLGFESFRDKLRPGQKETWTLWVKGPNREKVSAELLAYMYDRSLDAFVAHTFSQPSALYPNRSQYIYTQSNLDAVTASVLTWDWFTLDSGPSYAPDALLFYPKYSSGGVGYRHGFGGEFMEMASAPRGAIVPSAMPVEQSRLRRDGEPQKQKAGKAEDALEKEGDKQLSSGEQSHDQGESVTLRSDFRETAFFQPALLTDKDGKVKLEFQVPDSVTSWNVYVHALTQDMKYMQLMKQTQTAKDLMVRPYLPRFLREGDEAIMRVVVDNTTEKELSGTVSMDILDPEKSLSRLKAFSGAVAQQKFRVAGKQSTTVAFPLKAPSQTGSYAFKIVAQSGELSDGELRPLPVLPGRMHLSQSKFKVLKDNQTKMIELKDLQHSKSDATLIHDSLVVTLDSQLIYGVLKAVPYLTSYPYECLEQTLNRFLSTSILTSLYAQFPAMKALAQEFSKRDTQQEAWKENDPNRKMSLEELPWLDAARGGSKENLINVLDERIARKQKDQALEKIRKAQLANGAWPWFSGGPPSPYITLYLLHGFAKAAEFKVIVPKEMVQKAWRYLGEYYRDYYKGKFVIDDQAYCFITFLNYVLSAYPDASYYQGAFSADERREMLEYSFKYWKVHNPYSKALLAMTLKRLQRPEDAKLVMSSIMDSAKSSEEEGTHWAAEERSWLWYNDTIETHAFILRALMEVDPQNAKNDGIVLWLFLNKKLNQWKSTRTTAEVVYSLVTYLKMMGALGGREEATVKVGNQSHQFVFKPETYSGGQNQLIVTGDKVTPEMGRVSVEKKGKGYLFASTTWNYSTEKMPEEERGDLLAVSRQYFLRLNEGGRAVLKPLAEGAEIKVGDEIEVQLSLKAKHPCEYVHLRDPRAAGLEPEKAVSGHRWDLGIVWYEETRDSGTNFFFESLPQGEFPFRYRLRANMAGRFKAAPATLQSMYAPEFSAFSSGANLKIAP